MAPLSRTPGRALTGEELLALPAVIDLDTANRALAIGRSTGYSLAKRGHYPVRLLRLGTAYRVVTADLLSLLGLAHVGSDRQPGGTTPHQPTYPEMTVAFAEVASAFG